MIPPFSLHQPDSPEEASLLLARHGKDARLIAGGSELVLRLKSGVASARHLVDIKKIRGLNEVQYDGGARRLNIGALVTHRALESSAAVRDHFPLLGEMARGLGNVRVRNVGTLGGNLCLADPNSDPATLLTAYNASVRIGSTRGERSLDISDFLVGAHRTALERDEILTEISVPELSPNASDVYRRFCPWERPTVSVALVIEWSDRRSNDVRLVVGGVCPTPLRLSGVDEGLRNKEVDDIAASAEEAGRSAALLCDPVDDLWNSAAYKRHVVTGLVIKAILQACRTRSHG